MNINELFPVFVLEKETGDMKLVNEVNDLCLLVEEFWDILDEDFKFWDKNGYLIKFNKIFLDKNFNGIIKTNINEHDEIRAYLIEYGRKKHLNLDKLNEIDLVKLFRMIENN